MKKANLQSAERTKRVMSRVCSVADVMRCGRLRWFGHQERRSVDDWVSACRKVDRGDSLAGAICKGRNRETWKQCVDKDMEVPGLHPEWVVFRDVWRDLIWAKTSNPKALRGRNRRFQN